MKRLILFILSIIATAIGLLFATTWFSRICMDYNSEGKYFDDSSSVTYDDNGIIAYGFLTLLFIIIGIIGFIISYKLNRTKK